jgi:hypothetical protein
MDNATTNASMGRRKKYHFQSLSVLNYPMPSLITAHQTSTAF